MSNTTLSKEIIRQSLLRFNENCLRIEKCLEDLSDVEIWHSSNVSSNSIGNLMVHLAGNITQYIISGIGNEEDTRSRDEEFSINGGMSKVDIQSHLISACEKAKKIIMGMTIDDILEYRSVQGFKLTGFGILLHVIEHFSYHTGQSITHKNSKK